MQIEQHKKNFSDMRLTREVEVRVVIGFVVRLCLWARRELLLLLLWWWWR